MTPLDGPRPTVHKAALEYTRQRFLFSSCGANLASKGLNGANPRADEGQQDRAARLKSISTSTSNTPRPSRKENITFEVFSLKVRSRSAGPFRSDLCVHRWRRSTNSSGSRALKWDWSDNANRSGGLNQMISCNWASHPVVSQLMAH